MLDDDGNDTRRVREGDTESFAAAVLDGLSLGTDVDMPRLLVDVLLAADEPAGCWFHHEKATPPKPPPALTAMAWKDMEEYLAFQCPAHDQTWQETWPDLKVSSKS